VCGVNLADERAIWSISLSRLSDTTTMITRKICWQERDKRIELVLRRRRG